MAQHKNYSTPDLCDDNPNVLIVDSSIGFKNYGLRKSFGGEIVTIKCYEDNSIVKSQVEVNGKGKVMVVDGGGSYRKALLGDQLAEKASTNNWEGIIIYGCIRDVDEIGKTDIGVQALGSNPMKTEKRGLGDLNINITFGGVTFTPGQYVYADNNGIIISTTSLDK